MTKKNVHVVPAPSGGWNVRKAGAERASKNFDQKTAAWTTGERSVSIHDISRLQAKAAGDFSRFNLPFQLGMDRGAQLFGQTAMRTKCCLMLERNQHDFRRALSDLAGVDIKSHRDEPVEIVRAVRDWFVETVGLRRVASATQIWYRFTEFASDFYDARKADGYSDSDLNMMPVPEHLDFIRSWAPTSVT